MMPFADEDTDVKRQMGEPSLRALGHLLHEYPSPTVGDDEPETGCPGQMEPLVFGGQSALDGSASRDRVCPPARLRSWLSRYEMVVGLGPGPREADHRAVAPVCLGCHRAADCHESVNTAVVA